jgi:hypothetical protein
MERFFDWLYATHRNYLLGTGIAYFIPMYILELLLVINDGWIIKIMLFFTGVIGSAMFSFGMWFFMGKNAVERRSQKNKPIVAKL